VDKELALQLLQDHGSVRNAVDAYRSKQG
jgi:hypothetical protein